MMKCNESKHYFYYSNLSPIAQSLYRKQIKNFTRMLAVEYFGFSRWFDRLFTTDDQLVSDREILLCEDHLQLAGIAILKKTADERKICTLRVDKKFRKQGIGQELIERSFTWLDDEKPLITVHRLKEPQFRQLFLKYDFKLEQENRGYYRIFSTELAYNGVLPERCIPAGQFEISNFMQELRTLFLPGEKDADALISSILEKQIADIACKNILVTNR